MRLDPDLMRRVALILACAFTVANQFSIAAGQILLGAAILALLLTRERWRLPAVWMPLAFLILWTLGATALSADPRAGLPQIKKFYVWAALPVIYTAVRSVATLVRLVAVWGAAEGVQALYSIVQYGWIWERARRSGADFYRAYMARRITGTFSHWMTLGGVEMIVLLMLVALLCFGARGRVRWWMWAAAALIGVSVLLGGTRSIWLGSAAGALYLVARWKAKLLIGVPVVIALAMAAGPDFVRERALSLVRPHGTVDSNQHRVVTWRTGAEMVKAHPWFGVGPDMPGRLFDQYLPADIHKPLPEGFYGHLHNVYLEYAAGRGVPALLALLWILGLVAWRSLRAAARARDTDARILLEGAVAVVIGVMVEGFAEVNLGDSEVLTMFLAVVAMALVACDVVNQAQPPPPRAEQEAHA